MNEQQMKAELERLKAENETLKTRASRAMADEIRAFLKDNDSKLKTKP